MSPPAKHAPGTTATDRKRATTARRAAEGWRQVAVWLPPIAVAALAQLRMRHATDAAAIEAAIVGAANHPPGK